MGDLKLDLARAGIEKIHVSQYDEVVATVLKLIEQHNNLVAYLESKDNDNDHNRGN